MRKIKVLIVDDHALIRDGIKAMLKSEKDIEIAGEAVDGVEAFEKYEALQPDIIVMDIMMPKNNGLEAAKNIKAAYPDAKILFISMEVKEEFISEAIKVGASGYIPKDANKEILQHAIKAVNQGEKYFHRQVSDLIFNRFYENSITGEGEKKPLKAPIKGKISKRELEVLKLIASGYSNSNIAEQLFISVRTVDAHRNHIMQKLELSNTAQLVKYAIKNKIIELD